MKIRVVNRLWRQTIKGIGSPSSHAFCPRFELRPVANCTSTSVGRFMTTELDLDSSTYDENRDYSSEMTIPSLRYETQVMSFGDGSNGALGHHAQGYLSDAYSPETIKGLPTNIVKVAAGHYHSLAVTDDGEVWAWGRNEEGQLGPRDGNSRQEWGQPQRVKGLENIRVNDLAGSGVVSMALANDGSLWSWGSSKRGQLGLGPDVIQSKAPQQVEGLAGREVSKIALGWGHALVCTTNGGLYAWGYAADGRLGFNPEPLHHCKEGNLEAREATQRSEITEAMDMQTQAAMQLEQKVDLVWEPHRVDALAHEKVKNIACGMDHSLALAENGDLYSFGDNSLGQLGRSLGKQLVGTVKFPGKKKKVINCAAGLGHSFAVALDSHSDSSREMPSPLPQRSTKLTSWEKEIQEAGQGSLFSWGWNLGSQLGRAGDSHLPRLVEGLADERLVRFAAGRVHSAGLTSKRQVWIWGSGRNGRLGLDSPSDEPYPFPLEKLGFWKTLQVACGFDHTLLLVRTVVHSPGKGPCDSVVKKKEYT